MNLQLLLGHIKSAAELNNTLWSRMYIACIFLLGLLYGLSSYVALFIQIKSTEVPSGLMLIIFLLIAILIVFAYYVSFLAIIWAMAKLFKGKNKFLGFLRVTANAVPPLWIAVPVINYWLLTKSSGPMMTVLGIVSFLFGVVFIGRLLVIVALWFNLNKSRGTAALVATFIFLGSFLYLQFG